MQFYLEMMKVWFMILFVLCVREGVNTGFSDKDDTEKLSSSEVSTNARSKEQTIVRGAPVWKKSGGGNKIVFL